MTIAIIGSGFCGLAACYQLQCLGYSATLFDPLGVGGGASGIASGLMHPYPGREGRYSWKAHEGIAATRELLEVSQRTLQQPVFNDAGILRVKPLLTDYPDVVPYSSTGYLIQSGITVFTKLYLQGLWLACKAKGAVLYPVKVDRLEQLKDYDRVVIAAGSGVAYFEECRALRLRYVKGQILTCKGPVLSRSIVGNGYAALSETPGLCYLGATYERSFASEAPDRELATRELLPKMAELLPGTPEVIECRAGVRVMNASHYVPLIQNLDERTWVITGMGSRGLLVPRLLCQTARPGDFREKNSRESECMNNQFLFLGSGGSTGVPVIGCNCAVCASKNPLDRRLRPSGLLRVQGKTFLIDAGPDFREQALKYHIRSIDGLLLTHSHFDHIGGLDDLRAFNFLQKHKIPCLLSIETFDELKRRYHYLLQERERGRDDLRRPRFSSSRQRFW